MDRASNSTSPSPSSERDRTDPQRFGVYVHFPYCLAKCPYCDFASYPSARDAIDHEGYADAVIRELELRRGDLPDGQLATVFFGGGTPSLWEASALGRVLHAILSAFPVAPEVEVTAECNPTSLDEAKAAQLLEQGVNRVSIGVQSLDLERLRFLGRLHDDQGGVAAIRAAMRAGVPRISADLLFGVRGGREQSPEDAARDVRTIAETGVRHVSAYGLTIEPATQFGQLARRGKLPIASDDVIVDSFFAVEEALGALGFRHYEISNYAQPGEEARHNLGYWHGADYVGLGCAAVGALQRRGSTSAQRYKNHPDPKRYMRALRSGELLVSESEELDPETRLRERIMLGLRLEQGVDLTLAARPLGVEAWTQERRRELEALQRAGMIEVEGARVRVAPRSRAMTDGIVARLF